MTDNRFQLIAGPDHWSRRASEKREAWDVSEARVREIVREEIAWAMRLGGKSVSPPPQPHTPRGPQKLTAEKLARYRHLAAAYDGGLTFEQVRLQHGASPDTVRKACELNGVRIRNQGERKGGRYKDDGRIAQMIEMRARGATLEEIGAALRITRERARQIFATAGVDTSERPLNDTERAAVARYVAGDALDLAAASINVSTHTMRRLLQRAGEKPRPSKRKMSDTMAERSVVAARMYREGRKTKEIAAELGYSKPEMIYRLLALAGVRPCRMRRRA